MLLIELAHKLRVIIAIHTVHPHIIVEIKLHLVLLLVKLLLSKRILVELV